ncbi:hypothetical protein C0992_005654 [Termitomyces sp. T32_za158]|nr:hypothetical protein C0992_005654 [Termitomyces sp. T32_za158]
MKQRASRGTRSKEAEIIPRDIVYITRSDSKTSDTSGTTIADLEVRVERESIATSTFGTPVKPGNLKISDTPTTRRDVVDGFVYELLDRRWASADLVDHSFDNVVSISLAANITLCFLHYGIISVKVDNAEVKREQWPAACLHAASLARLASKAGKVTQKMEKRYVWAWSAHLNTGTERGAQDFLNLIGFLGYVFGNIFDLDPNNLSERKLRTRITTLPRACSRMPLQSPDSQDCCPDFFALHRSAFVNERDPTREGEYMEQSSILSTISTFWPKLSEKFPWLFPSLSQENISNSGDQNDEERAISPLSFTPEGSDELLDDLLHGKYTQAEGDEHTNILSDDKESDLSTQLENLLKALEVDAPHHQLPTLLSEDIKEYGKAAWLDLSLVCFPNVLIAGEGKQTDMRSATGQTMAYMCQQRRAQPWLRFCLGLMITKDKMGLLRADATGVEECVFPKNIGRGVIESIRLSLGVLLATDQELGQHPSFLLRSVTKLIEKDEGNDIGNDDHGKGAKKRRLKTSVSREEGMSKKLRLQTSEPMSSSPTDPAPRPRHLTSREVGWITLDEGKLHGQYLRDQVPTKFYVKYLLEDRGSLVGRCTRVWCVYQEVFESDPLLDRYQKKLSKGSRVMKGPYALKICNADMFSETYQQDILVKTMNIHRSKPLDGVLLPTHVWHLGEILFLVRGLTQDERPPTILLDKMKNRIESLEAIKIIHRDISFGNIILNEEIYCDTDKEFDWIYEDKEDGKRGRVALIRRETVDIGVSGGLHDLDSAAYIPKTAFVPKSRLPPAIRPPEVAPRKLVSPVQQDARCDPRTGTLPFMSISLLLGGQNSVSDDLQSLFFVLYLSMFTFDKRLPNCFPDAPPPLRHRWPQQFTKWTDLVDMDVRDLGSLKATFFLSYHESWYDALISDALSLWKTSKGNKAFNWAHWTMLRTFYDQLWFRRNDATGFGNANERTGVTPLSIRTALQAVFGTLDMNLEFPLTDRYDMDS